MAEDQGKEEEKFDFTREGEAVGYISLAQARLLAMSTAREAPGDYGSSYQGVPMAFEATEAIEDEDFYNITLSFRPQGNFSGTPGQEQFFIEKEGTVAHRQVLRLPGRGGFPLLPVAIGLVVVGVIAAVGAVFMLGGTGDDGAPVAVLTPTETPAPTEATRPVIAPTTATVILTPSPTRPMPTLRPTLKPTPTPRPILTPTRRPTLTPTPTPRPIRLPTVTPTPTPHPNASSYYRKGWDYNNAGKYQLAIDEFTTAIRLNPNYLDAYWARGNAYVQLGQYKQSIQDFDKGIQLDPSEAILYGIRGNAYGKLGQYENAIEDFDKAIQLDPDDAWAYNNRSVTYGNLGQYSQQRADEARACSLDSKYCTSGPLPPLNNESLIDLYIGTVSIGGSGAPNGAEVTAWLSEFNAPIGTALFTDGSYVLWARQYGSDSFKGKTISFKVNGQVVPNVSATYTPGGAATLDLVVP